MTRILLVGFEKEEHDRLRELLKRRGNRITWETDTAKAAHAIRRRRFDIGLIDAHLPGMSGLQFIDGLSNGPLPYMPLILLIDAEEEERMNQAVASGEIMTLLKSDVSPHTLECAIRLAEATRRIRTRLQETSEMMYTLIDRVPMMIYARDAKGTFLLANQATADALQMPIGRLVGSRLQDVLASREEVGRLLKQDRTVIESGKPMHIDEQRLTTPKGRAICISTTKIPFDFPGTDQKAILCIALNQSDALEKQELVRTWAALEAVGEAILITDPAGSIEYVNPAFERMTGFSRDEAIGNKPSIVKSGKHDAAFYEEMWSILRKGETFRGVLFNRRKDGSFYEAEETISPIKDQDNNIVAYIAVERDITDRRLAEEALRRSDERYRLATEATNDGLWDWDIEPDAVYASPRMLTIIGLDPEKVKIASSQDLFDLVHPDDREDFIHRLKRHLKGLTEYFHHEYRMLDTEGNTHWMLGHGLALRDDNGKAYRFAGSQTDITEFKDAQEKLQDQARRDPLTGFPNREMMLEHISGAIGMIKEEPGRQAYLLYLDIDRFKNITDSIGHILGDRLLLKVARRLKEGADPDDVVARLSGDEFAILVTRPMSISESEEYAWSLAHQMDAPFKLEGQMIRTSASFGIAVIDAASSLRPEHILRNADVALRTSKTSDTTVTVFNRAMHEAAAIRLRTENDLDKAIEDGEFVLHYQPIIDLQTERLSGFEALVRWQHGDELISPDQFIPIAEATGQIIRIGKWVISKAIRQLHDWQQQPGCGELYLSLNLSPLQLKDERTIEVIGTELENSGVNPSSVRIEITESAILEDAKRTMHQLNQLKTLGVLIYLDDFGTGYSSFSYLYSLPLDIIKIDRSFITDIHTNQRKAMIVRSIIQMSHNLGHKVVAEGIEGNEQSIMLRTLECDYGQGYFYSRPLPTDEALAMSRS